MTDAPDPAAASGNETRNRHLVDFAPLKASPAFARLWVGGLISGIGTFVSAVAVGLQIYAITESTFMVGLVGGVALIPMIIAGLWGGVLADVFDRRRVLIASALVAWASVLGLVALSVWEAHLASNGTHSPVWPFFIVTTINSVAGTIMMTTRGSVIGRILPEDMISRANALNGISFGTMLTLGPALAGILAATVGLPWTFAVDAVLFSAGFLGIWTLPALPRLGEQVDAGWHQLVEGMQFLRRSPNIRMSFIVDIVAMTFGRPYVLFPALGATVIGGGPLTVGALTAAGAVGTALASIFSGPVARIHRHGVAIARAITAYGIFVLIFGIAAFAVTRVNHHPSLGWDGIYWPALVVLGIAMAGMGASDEVSAIFRSSMIIQAAPDEMRGRLQGVFVVVVTGGPRVGDLYAGILATAVALWFPPLLGGMLIVALIAVLTRVQKGWREYDARNPTP